MNRVVIVSLLMLVSTSAAPLIKAVQTPRGQTLIFVEPTDDGFQNYIIAAIMKKKVPASVVDRPELASLTLRAARVEEHQESGASKVARCLFAYCAGINDKANTSVQLVDGQGVIVWSYSVNKARGEKNRQSMAEAIASHLKSDYFRR